MSRSQSPRVPQGPWFNPNVPDGVHRAIITQVLQGTYRNGTQTYLQVVLWLLDAEQYVVSNFYFEKQDSRSVLRLNGLCRSVGGLIPQDAFDFPRAFEGSEIQVEVVSMPGQPGNGHKPYKDVAAFLPAAAAVEAPADSKPSAKPIVYVMQSYED